METKGSVINFEDVRKILPHRYPFLLVDRILSVTSNSIQALKNVTANEPFFKGHFPEFAVMPGVLQVEAMAQACGLILAYEKEFDVKSQLAFLAGIDDARFKRVVVPGDQLLLFGGIMAKKKNVVRLSAKASVDGQVASEATITLVIRPR